MFAHGFNIRYGCIEPACGRGREHGGAQEPRATACARSSARAAACPALVAVHQDASGPARALALAYARGLGCTRAGVIETTFTEETETDLFGEKAVLCGGASALVKAGFETLVEAGYQPEIAYFECLHELKLIVDLMYQGGLSYMRYSVSDTAEYGDYTGGPRIVTDQTKAEMKEILKEIQDGRYAKAWIEENAGPAGTGSTASRARSATTHQIEKVGGRLRAMMPFLDAVEVSPEGDLRAAVAGVAVAGGAR